MHTSIVDLLACPHCSGGLYLLDEGRVHVDGSVQSGMLTCKACATRYPIVGSIPRFVSSKNYAKSFGLEWELHSRTQVDRYNGTTISRDRFFRQTWWPADLSGQRVLEVGCGSGRFTQVALDAGAEVFSVDYSSAADVNLRNNGPNRRLHVFQADARRLPFKTGLFDRAYCIGVLQHTPAPDAVLKAMASVVKPGGIVSVDIYARSWETYVWPKNWLRPFTKRLPQMTLYRGVRCMVPFLLPVKAFLRRRVPKVGRYIAGAIPVASYAGHYPLSKEQQLEWSFLDTFDALSPKYDKPATAGRLRKWMLNASFEDVRCELVSTGLLGANGRKGKS